MNAIQKRLGTILLAVALALPASTAAVAQNGLPTIAPSADDERPAYDVMTRTKQPDFVPPDYRPGGFEPAPQPRVIRPRPPVVAIPDGRGRVKVFAPVCGRIGNQVARFSNDSERKAAGAVRVGPARCR